MLELLMMTRDEAVGLMDDRRLPARFRGILLAEGALGPLVVRESAFDRFLDGDDWYWCAERLIYCPKLGLIVGSFCFKNMPQHQNGQVEIGYGIAPACRKQGYATEAVALMAAEAFRHSEVNALTADTLELNSASIRVLEKNGFQRVGERYDEEDGALIEWRKVSDRIPGAETRRR